MAKQQTVRQWAKTNGTTPEELKLLMDSISPASWPGLYEPFVDSMETDGTIPDDFYSGMKTVLEQGRRGELRPTFQEIGQVMGISPDRIVGIITARKDGLYEDAVKTGDEPGMENLMLNSRFLPGLLLDIQADNISLTMKERARLSDLAAAALTSAQPKTKVQDSTAVTYYSSTQEADIPSTAEAEVKNQPAPNNTGNGTPEQNASGSAQPDSQTGTDNTASAKKTQSKPAEKTAKKPSRKKTKYTVSGGKNAVARLLLETADITNTRSIREFLLSMPDYSPQDVALMCDEEVRAAFTENYKCIGLTTGTLVLGSDAFTDLAELLGGYDICFLPNAKTED